MEIYALIVFGGLAVLLLGMLVLGAMNRKSVAELTGRSDHARWATQARIEGGDGRQMVDPHNAHAAGAARMRSRRARYAQRPTPLNATASRARRTSPT